MIVRCGRCGSEFDVPGSGRHVCPACGTANDVRIPDAAAGIQTPRPPPPPDKPSPRVICPGCGYKFIVGEIDVAPCPNCGEPVTVTAEAPSADEGEEE
jgi:rRNA maturation endonuclease Nob1